MGPTCGLSGTDRTQVGPMLPPWTLLSRLLSICKPEIVLIYSKCAMLGTYKTSKNKAVETNKPQICNWYQWIHQAPKSIDGVSFADVMYYIVENTYMYFRSTSHMWCGCLWENVWWPYSVRVQWTGNGKLTLEINFSYMVIPMLHGLSWY